MAVAMNKTGIICEGFGSKRWQKIHRREVDVSRKYASLLVEFAKSYSCSILAFEHLVNLKPKKGKYSRRSNQKRAYWLKSRVFNQAKEIAYRDYSILTTRVSPKNTSRLDPWGNKVWRGNVFPTNLLTYLEYEPGTSFVATTGGYKAHSGINAARNIGMKAIVRHKSNALFKIEKSPT